MLVEEKQTMNATVSVQDLWSQIWLQDKLKVYESEEEEHLTPYTMEELNARIDQALADVKAGRCITAEEADKEMEEFLATL